MAKNVTRGAKSAYQQFALTSDVLFSTMRSGMLLFLLVCIFGVFLAPNDLRYNTFKYVESLAKAEIISYMRPQGRQARGIKVKYHNKTFHAKALKDKLESKEVLKSAKASAKKTIITAMLIVLLYLIIVFSYFYRKGKKMMAKKFIRGGKIISSKDLREKIEKDGKASDIFIADVPIIKGSELQNTAIFGAPGSGKSVCIRQRFEQIRKKNQRAIVYDRSGTYVSQFYRPGKDIILNPLDKRSKIWSIWGECKTTSDIEALATAIIPPGAQASDPFWIDAARIMFSETASKMLREGTHSSKELLRNLLTASIEDMREYLQGTLAEALTSDEMEKMTLSVKAELATYIKFLRYLPDSDNPFSIRDWVEGEDDSWIFFTSTARQHASLKPFLSCGLDVAATSICSLEPDLNRRIHLNIDEAPTLQNMPALELLVSEGRKYGASFMFSAQSPSQLFKIYGEQGAKTIIDCCSTQIIFRVPGGDNSKWISQMLGEQEIELANENLSFSAGSMRENLSLNHHDKIQSLVLPSEISGLDDLQAYLKLKGSYPMTRVQFTFQKYEAKQPGLVPLDDLQQVENQYMEGGGHLSKKLYPKKQSKKEKGQAA
jgi:type IV conjugative transfer system coupling protein TraD